MMLATGLNPFPQGLLHWPRPSIQGRIRRLSDKSRRTDGHPPVGNEFGDFFVITHARLGGTIAPPLGS